MRNMPQIIVSNYACEVIRMWIKCKSSQLRVIKNMNIWHLAITIISISYYLPSVVDMGATTGPLAQLWEEVAVGVTVDFDTLPASTTTQLLRSR
jgi:hypothetical protein